MSPAPAAGARGNGAGPAACAPRPAARLAGARPLLDESGFARLVLAERRRAERAGRPFGLLVVDPASASRDPGASRLGRAVRAAILASTREIDVAGWIAAPGTLGVLLPDLPDAAPWAAVERARARLARALGRALGTAGTDVTVTGRVFPGPIPVADGAAGLLLAGSLSSEPGARADLLLYPELGEADGARRRAARAKRALDVAGSLALLLALAPVMLVLAALVRWTSPGPVLFRQVRVGRRGRPFTMLKFRTMRADADDRVHREFVTRLIAEGERAAPSSGTGLYKLAGDPRVTPVGRILRRTSLDELPQLWNVLRGEMSLVGARPPLPYELERYAPWQCRRVLEVPPGLTGPWQVWGRSRTTFDEMVRLDLRYGRTASLGTDLRILLATPRAAISGKGAC